MNNKPYVFHTAFAVEHRQTVSVKEETEATFTQSYLFVNALFAAINFMTKEIEETVFHGGGAKAAEVVSSCQMLSLIGLGFAEEMSIQFADYKEQMEGKSNE